MNLDDLARIHAASFTTPRPWSADEIGEMLSDRFTFLATSPDGFVLGRVIADEAELLTIAVAPDARGTGQGRALMASFLAAVRARGAETVFLEVAADNDRAQDLYRKTGFVESGRRKRYYHRPDGSALDALVMQLPLISR